MDLVRLPKRQKLIDTEQIFGRDAKSVFPTREAEPSSAAQAAQDLSSQRFVSEAQLAELREQRGEAATDGNEAPLKPLTQVLAENKEAHEAKFQAVWKSMKTGKNRPLDDDELAFVNEHLSLQRAKDSSQAAEEQEQLAAFKLAMLAAREQSQPAAKVRPKVLGPQAPPPAVQQPAKAAPTKPVLRAVARPRAAPVQAVKQAAAVQPVQEQPAEEPAGQGITLLGGSDTVNEWASRGTWFEYGSAADPDISPIPIDAFTGAAHQSGPSSIVPLDLSEFLGTSYPATSPNLLSSFVRVTAGKRLETHANATSQTFYVIRGSGETRTEWGTVQWHKGDVMVLPATQHPAVHHCDKDCKEGAAFYWVHDAPLLAYLGVRPVEAKFKPTFFKEEEMTAEVLKLRDDPKAAERNRCGILLATEATAGTTKTLSHVLWALYNLLPANSSQPPHKHSALALDLAITAPEGKCYTMMSPDIDDEGQLIDPVKVPWSEGGVFTTPPGWWHSHHNESDSPAWVYPVQDAALYTYQRTLNIRFGKEQANIIREHRQVGATFKGEDIEAGYRIRNHH